MRRTALPLLILAAAAFVASCGKRGDQEMSVAQSGVDQGRMEDQFGKGFGEAFRADPNAEPAKVSDRDVEPVSLTAEPKPVE